VGGDDLDGEGGLRIQDLPSPTCGLEQVRIANHAAALNFPDVLITRGQYQLRLEPPFVPGSECAGVVAEVGSDVAAFAVGDRVLIVSGVGAFADEIVVTPSVQQVHAMPDGTTFIEAAGFAMVYGTALHDLRQRGALQSGESVLVLGSSGGCGGADETAALLAEGLRSMPLNGADMTYQGEPAWKSTPSTHVLCTEDRAIPVEAQRWMAARADEIIEWPTDHSPFLSRPQELAALLVSHHR
jgi:NADPH-dependent curcumin reductase CurA